MAGEAAKGLGEGLGKVGSGLAKQIILPKHWPRNIIILATASVGLPALSEAWSVSQAGGSGAGAFVQAFTTNVASTGATVAHAVPDAAGALWNMGGAGVEHVSNMPWGEIWEATSQAASGPTGMG
jgi:hypothetical protein